MAENTPVQIPETITVGEFATKLGLKSTDVMSELMKNGVMATINESIDFDTAAIIGGDLGFEIEEAVDDKPEVKKTELKKGEGVDRPPVIAVMGHVDHGKTSLLDAIREADVASSEAGGITQHISAYQITYNKRLLTFLDTPGHEAFAALRQHGARLTDVAVIVVAADDGVKPQTEEAIKFAQKAGVKIVVAINKIDAEGANPNLILQQISEVGLAPEAWGGDVVTVEVSAKKKTNIDKLLDVILLVADIEELKARADGPSEGIVIESHLDRGRGPVATILVEHGELQKGDFIVAGDTYARVRNLENHKGKNIKVATASMPVEVTGFKAVPSFGTPYHTVNNEKEARAGAVSTRTKSSAKSIASIKKISSEEDMHAAVAAGDKQEIPVLVKADVQGSLESVQASLDSIGNSEVGVKIVETGIGNISESDITRAAATKAQIIGFSVSIPTNIKRLAIREGVEITIYNVIYELIDDLKEALSRLLAPEIIEKSLGSLEVKGVFKLTKSAVVCGGLVTSGKITPGIKARIKHEDEVIREAVVDSVQKEKNESKEVVEGEMCGLNLKVDDKTKVEIGDTVEFYEVEVKARKL